MTGHQIALPFIVALLAGLFKKMRRMEISRPVRLLQTQQSRFEYLLGLDDTHVGTDVGTEDK